MAGIFRAGPRCLGTADAISLADRSERFLQKSTGRGERSSLHRRGTNLVKLNGRTALITGASQGLGAEIARQFVAEGASVVICARNATQLAEQRQRLQASASASQRVVAHACDIGEREETDRLFAVVRREFPRL